MPRLHTGSSWINTATAEQSEGKLATMLNSERKQLLEDFSFVAACNVGGEFLDDGKRARLVEISHKTWQRHFDDRLGLSPLDELRVMEPAAELPVTEQLLSDKPEHIIKRTTINSICSATGYQYGCS